MSKRKDQLMAAVEKATQKQHSAEQEKKRYLEQLKQLERNERTYRLCTRGAYLESLLQEPEAFSDEEVFKILDYVFRTPYAKSYLKATLEEKHRGSDGEKADTLNKLLRQIVVHEEIGEDGVRKIGVEIHFNMRQPE